MAKIVSVYKGQFGICDFIRGVGYLNSVFHGIYEVEWSVMTPLRAVMKYPGKEYPGVEPIRLDQRLSDSEIKNSVNKGTESEDIIFVSTNHNHDGKSHLEFIKPLFDISDAYQEEYELFTDRLIKHKPYRIIHCRLGDSYFYKKSSTHLYPLHLERLRANIDESTIVITDDGDFKEYLRRMLPTAVLSDFAPVHPALNKDIVATAHTFFELHVITGAREITCQNSLPWPISGFSSLPAKVFGIPWTVERILP